MMLNLEDRHTNYLKTEFGIDDIDAIGDDAFDELFDKLCVVEEVEFDEDGDPEIGNLATEIKDYMIDAFEYSE